MQGEVEVEMRRSLGYAEDVDGKGDDDNDDDDWISPAFDLVSAPSRCAAASAAAPAALAEQSPTVLESDTAACRFPISIPIHNNPPSHSHSHFPKHRNRRYRDQAAGKVGPNGGV